MGNDRRIRRNESGLGRRWAALPAIVACAVAVLAACGTELSREVTVGITHQVGDAPDHVSTHTTDTQGEEDVEASVDATLVDRLPLRTAVVHPVNAVFIGVSNFAPQSGKVATPAHAIGANYVEKIFRDALDRQPLR